MSLFAISLTLALSRRERGQETLPILLEGGLVFGNDFFFRSGFHIVNNFANPLVVPPWGGRCSCPYYRLLRCRLKEVQSRALPFGPFLEAVEGT